MASDKCRLEEEEGEQKLEFSDDGLDEENETSPANNLQATTEINGIPVNVKAKMPDVPLADEYTGGEFFFVRKCYAEYYLKVEAALVEKMKQCVTVTGTPGTL
ncbi:hypothetical protein DVH05_005471 [Phytophthora capsici]|nr:hypothetical protein DVH05_005471 [Phytophthora capsici]